MYKLIGKILSVISLLLFPFLTTTCRIDKGLLFVNEVDKYITAPLEEDYTLVAIPEERWSKYGINDYVITQQLGCFCPARGPFKIFVVNNKIVDVLDISADTLLSKNGYPFTSLKTVIDLFDLTYEIDPDSVADIRIEYNSRFGFPKLISVDPDSIIVDEEYSYYTTSLEKIVDVLE